MSKIDYEKHLLNDVKFLFLLDQQHYVFVPFIPRFHRVVHIDLVHVSRCFCKKMEQDNNRLFYFVKKQVGH